MCLSNSNTWTKYGNSEQSSKADRRENVNFENNILNVSQTRQENPSEMIHNEEVKFSEKIERK